MTMTRRSMFGLALAPLAPIPHVCADPAGLVADHHMIELTHLMAREEAAFRNWFMANINPRPDWRLMPARVFHQWRVLWREGYSPRAANEAMHKWLGVTASEANHGHG